METIVERLKHWSEIQPQKIALQRKLPTGYERITYRELWEKCRAVANDLKSSGLKPGDHTCVYGENTPGWAISYIAIHISGGVIVPLDAQLSARDSLNIIRYSDCKAIIADSSRLPELEALFQDEKYEVKLFSIEELTALSDSNDRSDVYNHDPGDTQTIVFTSGTTGEPKGVMLTCENIMSNIQALVSFTEVSSSDNVLSILPLNHAYPCIVGLLSPLFAGATVTFSHSLKSLDLFGVMKDTGVTVFPGVPKLFTLLDREIFNRVKSLPVFPRIIFWILYTLAAWVRKTTGIRIGKLIFKSIHGPFGGRFRFFASGGAKLDPKVSEHFLNLGFLVIEGYGLTETSAVSTLNPLKAPKTGTAGIPIRGVEIRIDSPDPEGVGEICIKGSNVMKGYYKNEKATKEVLRDGWFHTGDLGMIDSDGNILVTGRVKEVIVLSSGKNIYPEEVEKFYENIPFAKELCVLPSYDDSGFVKGLRMVVVPDDQELISRGVFNKRDRISSEITMRGASLPTYMRITELELYNDQFPRTMLGKIRRSEVERYLAEQQKAIPRDEISLTPEEKELMEAPSSIRFLKRLQEIAHVSGPFFPGQELSIDLGLDSLTLVQITVVLENEFGLELKEEDLPRIRNIGDVLRLIREVPGSEMEGPDVLLKTLFQPPSKPLEEVFNLERGIFKRIVMRIIQMVVFISVRVVLRMRIVGMDKIPREGPVLLCPNHQSYIDPIVIVAALPGWILDRLLLTGFSELFKKAPLSWIVRPLRVIPIGSTDTFGDSLELTYDGLKRGMALLLFPEGRRTPTGNIMPARMGVGILSVEAKVPIIPILIEGAANTLSPLHPGFKFAKVNIVVGDPIEPPREIDHSRELYQEVCARWKDAVEKLENQLRRDLGKS
ncbi:MAG: AMP-binding protein [Thermodesulfobacteriota bacterium]